MSVQQLGGPDDEGDCVFPVIAEQTDRSFR